MQLIELFSYILDHTGAGVSGSGFVILGFYIFSLVQMGSGLVQALQFYFQIIPGSSVGQKVLSSIIPLMLLTSVAMVEPLFFAMFTGGRFHRFDYLRETFSNRQFYCEVLLLFLLYTVSALTARWFAAFRKAAKPSPSGKLIGLLALPEIIFILAFGSLCVLALTFEKSGTGVWSNLLTRNDTAMLWMVYGIYLVLYKTVVRFFAVLWSALFIPREIVLDDRDPREYGDTLIVREIRQSYGLSGKIALQYVVICGFLLFVMKRDPSTQDMWGFLIFVMCMLAACVLWVVISFLLWLFPRRASRYKAFGALNAYDIPNFNTEYFGKNYTYENSDLWLTKTFMIHKKPFSVQPLRALPPEQQEWIKYRQNSMGEGE